MALALADRVQETSTTTGTGTLTLAGAVVGYQSFAVVGDGNTTYYTITNAAGAWEVGIGTYTSAGTLLSRTTVLSSSNGGALVSFTGTLNVFVTYPSSKSVYGDGTTLVAPSGTILPIVSGGTGASTAGAALTSLGAYPASNPSGYTNNTGTVTGVTGTAPVVSSGGTAPAISMAAATTSVDGYLTSTDWNTFNSKTSNIGTVTSVAASVPAFLSVAGSPITTSGTLAISYSGTALPVANGGTGATTLTGVVYGNGTSAFTAATGAQIATAIGATAVTNATNATNVALTTSATASAFKVPFANTTVSTTGNYDLLQDSADEFTYNPSTNTLTVGTFAGSGASLTSLDASNLTSGTVPDARISGSYTGMTNLTGTGTVDFAKFLGNGADTAALPSFSWTGDINTGIYQPAADQIGISTGGTSRFVVSTSAITSTLPIRNAVGSAAAPTYSTSGDTNTGIYFPAADTIGFAEGGVEALRITSTGAISVGSSGTNYGTSGQVLTSNGNAYPTWATPAGSNITAQGLYENAAIIAANYTIGTGNNAVSAGPITINSGIVVTVPSGSTWVVV